MVSSINNSSINPPKTTKTSIFYVNDVHSNIVNVEKLKTASDEFDSFVPSEKTDKLKFSAGDFCLGKDIQANKYGVFAQNNMGIMASAVGNHEFDLLKDQLAEVMKDNDYKFLGINVDIPEDNEENKALKSEITKSYIQEKNGTKYGIIGLLPFDFALHASYPKEYSDFNVYSLEKTIPIMQEEINKMKEQGVDKIIVLSHGGNKADVQLAQSVEGIDVIIGGHSHNLVKGIEEGKNLFYSKKTGEPTIITQAGKDGKYFGVLNLEFDEKGVIKSVQNNVNKTEDFTRSPIMKFFTDKFFGKPQTIGMIKSVEKHGEVLTSENPSANFINDVLKSELDVDMSLINAANMRSRFEKGAITDRELSGMVPFKNDMCIVKLTEKEVVGALKAGAKSLVHPESMPGLIQASGLKYTVSKTGEVKDAAFIDKDGKEIKINIDSPNPFKTYRVALDSFIAMGGNNLIPDKMQELEARFPYDKDKIVIDYLKKHPEPIDIKKDGRIQIVD